MNKKLLLFILMAFYSIISYSQVIDFFREDLFFILDENSFQVSGDYYFYNPRNEPLRLAMAYPFPQDESMGHVSEVYAFDRNDIFLNCLARFNQKTGKIYLHIYPKQIKVLRIGYTHELLSNKAIYILTTTAAWGKPFKEAYYELHVPFDIQVDSMSYEPDEIQQVGGLYIYIFKRRNFMPEKDFEIYFSN